MERIYFFTRKYLVIGILWSFLSTTAGELSLLKQRDALHCVTTDDKSALSWILMTSKITHSQDIPQETSAWRYSNNNVTRTEVESLQCNLMDNSCTGWTGGSVIKNTDVEASGVNFGPVRDYRWNKLLRYQVLPQYQTPGIEIQPPRHNEQATYHISILAYDDAYIYLSEGNDPSRYKMYWLILDGWSRTKSVVRKCPRGEYRQTAIDKQDKKDCYDREYNTAAGKYQNVLEQGKQWKHFTLHLYRYRKSGYEGIDITLSDGYKTVLKWDNAYYAFNINHIFFRNYFFGSKQNFWRFHQYNILEPNAGVSKISSPEVKILLPRRLCLSIIYFSSAEARINVRENGDIKSKEELQSGTEWQVKRIEVDVNPSTIQVEFTFDKNKYFYLGDVRVCEENESFVSTLNTDTPYECRDINTDNKIAYNPVTIQSARTFGCLGDSFGQNCSLSCSAILQSEECKGVVVNGDTYSSCISGFYSPYEAHGQYCDYECGAKAFGPNCRFLCGKCSDDATCDRKTGRCANGCTGKYRRPLCRDEWPTLDLSTSKVHGTEIDITTEQDSRAFSQVTEVLLQYRKPGEEKWEDVKRRFSWPLASNLSVQGLKANVEYELRAILLENGDGYFGDDIKSITIKTPCVLVDESNIATDANTTMISINWSTNDESCPETGYQIQLNESPESKSAIDMLPFTIPDLNPNTTYNITITNVEHETFLIVKTVTTIIVEEPEKEEIKETVPLAAIVSPIIILLIIAIIIVAVLMWRHKKRNLAEDSQKININFTDDTVTISGTNQTIPASGRSQPIKIISDRQDSEKLISPPSNKTKVQTLPRNRPQTLIPCSFDEPGLTPKTIRKTDSKAGAVQKLSCPVHLDDFESYVERCLATKELESQHALFPRGQTQPWDYGRLPENKMKNRYGNLVAYDATRVKLTPIPGDLHSDYINANYIDGYDEPKAYIATQGPKANTINDFWKMVWQEKVNLIVMLANVVENGKTKCEKYWPDVPQSMTYGDVTIVTISEDVYADYTFRSFHVMCGGEKRVAQHLHFTSWPDHGVPYYSQSLTAFLTKMSNFETTGPILVHCSAGVGRTGTIILADMCLKMGEKENKVDPLGMLQKMRSQRANLVDNADQFEFVHIILLDYYLADSFNIPCASFISEFEQLMANHGELLTEQFTKINYLCNRDILRKMTAEPGVLWPEDKSRFPDIAPGNYGRVLLNRSTGGINYINAVYVDGFRTKGQFIATQLPLPDTVTDLWYLVTQSSSSLIIVLNKPDPQNDQTTCNFWPMEEAEISLPDSCTIVLKRQIDTKLFTHLRLQSRIEDQEGGDVNLLLLKGWESGAEVPADTNQLIHLWEEAERLYTGKGPIIVMCHDGARACGLFLASVFVVEKMKLEKEVDVGLAVRSIRLTRPHFITSIEQFEFLHDLAMMYQNSFETYANFQ